MGILSGCPAHAPLASPTIFNASSPCHCSSIPAHEGPFADVLNNVSNVLTSAESPLKIKGHGLKRTVLRAEGDGALSNDQARQMMQALLANRFQLTFQT